LVIVGHAVDLRGFHERARSHITGLDLGGLLEVRSVSISDRSGLHDGLELVLGGLLECTAVQLVDPPSIVDYYQRMQIDYRVVHGGRCHADVELGLAYAESEPDLGTLCNELDERASLQDYRPERLAALLEKIRDGKSNSELLLARPVAGESDVYDTATLPLMRPGRYLVWLRTSDNRSIAMRCFRAVSSQLSIYVQGGGGLAIPNNRYAARVEFGTSHPFGPTKLGRIGPRVGYSLRGQRNPDPDDPSNPIRHGLVLGGYIGFDIPVSSCVHGPANSRRSLEQQAKRCSSVARRSWSVAGNFGAGADFDFRKHDAVQLFEVSIQLMVKVQVDVRTSCFLFSRLGLWSDLDRALLVGAGVAWDIRKR
jgi:hypothetical protein